MTREHFQQQLRELDAQIIELGDLVIETIKRSDRVLETMDAAEAQSLIEDDNAIDRKRYAIENAAFVVMATQQPMARDLREVVSILTIASELERIGDYCEGIAKLILRMASETVHASLPDVRNMAEVTEKLVADVMQAFRDRDLEAAGRVWMQDDTVDELYGQVFRKQLLEMASDRGYIRQGTYTLWIAHNFERIADRVTNIAERVAFIVSGDIAGFRDHLRAQDPRV